MYPSSPKYNSGNFDHHQHHSSPHQVVSSNDLSPLPISPHVNVPNAHSFAPAPPLPPRVRRKTMQDFSHSQIRQAPDAPELPTRDQSPPPLPPRSHLHTNLRNMNENCWNHIPSQVMSLPASGCCTPQFPQFKLAPQTSTIMMRRNSALEQQRKDSPQTPQTPLSATSLAASPASFDSKLSLNSPISVPPRKIR